MRKKWIKQTFRDFNYIILLYNSSPAQREEQVWERKERGKETKDRVGE